MNLTYAYIFLAFAIVLEVLGTSFLKDTNGFTRLYPSLFVLLAFCICIYLMSHTMKFIPVGITYATWSGLGIVAITIISVFKYKQIPNIPTIIGLGLIVIGVTIVNLMNDINVK
jgi:small multidrug resistance pump